MARLVVVGAGISGLAAAWSARVTAARAGVTLDVLVLERSAEVGGKARTVAQDGWMVEGGPSGFLGGRAELDLLIRAGDGLENDVISANASAKRRFLYRAGRMREIRPSPLAFARSGILSIPGLLRLGVEPFISRSRDERDETVWAFAARRLGREAADRLIAPMTLGVFAGDARRLSLASAFPKMAALEREHGSLLRGMIARRRSAAHAASERAGTAREGDIAESAPAGQLASFRHGMQSLPRKLAEHGGFRVRCNATVRAIARTPGGWSVAVAGDPGAIEADAVIIAAEPSTAAQLLRPLYDRCRRRARRDSLPAFVTVVALGYDAAARARIPDGFGVLIARGEGIRMLGNLWETSIYTGRGPAGGLLVRALFGGAVDAGIHDLTDDEMVALATREVAQLYRLTAAPVFQQP